MVVLHIPLNTARHLINKADRLSDTQHTHISVTRQQQVGMHGGEGEQGLSKEEAAFHHL